jgi:hypothetical protein
MSDQTEAADQLREMLPPGSTAQTILRHVSASGMTRWISVVIDGEDYSWLVARAIGTHIDSRHGGLKRVGCGMDMGFDLVYSLSRTLYPDGFACIGDKCPANDHNNRVETDWHKSGGYAVSQRWL